MSLDALIILAIKLLLLLAVIGTLLLGNLGLASVCESSGRIAILEHKGRDGMQTEPIPVNVSYDKRWLRNLRNIDKHSSIWEPISIHAGAIYLRRTFFVPRYAGHLGATPKRSWKSCRNNLKQPRAYTLTCIIYQ